MACAAAGAVPYEHHALKSEEPDERLDVGDEVLQGVGWSRPVAFAVSTDVQGHHVVFGGHRGGEPGPASRAVPQPVEQQHRRGRALTPFDVVQPKAV